MARLKAPCGAVWRRIVLNSWHCRLLGHFAAPSEKAWIAHQAESEWTRIRSMISAARGAPPLVRIESRIRSAAER